MSNWEPPASYRREEIQSASNAMLARPDNEIVGREDIFRVSSLGLDWDMAGAVYEPADRSRIPVGPDGKKIGVFMQHGGEGDYRAMTPRAEFLAEKLGYRVFCMTMPGKLYFPDPDRAWPGDTINPDGTARTPLWKRGLEITPDQYELVQDRSDPDKRAKWGTLFFLNAKEGSEFYDRMAAWPVAFDDAIRDACERHFPADEWTIYVHGHSTGGPFVHNMLQRIDNVAGLIGMESSPFGAIYSRMLGMSWDFPFTYLTIRTWRHIAKYAGTEAGPEGCKRLPWLMEDVFDAWDRAKSRPQFKGEYIISYGAADTLEQAGQATARRLGLDKSATDALIARYRGYANPLQGPGTRPLPPLLYGIAAGSRDHGIDRYQNVVLPTLAALDRPPHARVVRFEAGVHSYTRPEPGLPRGLLPAIATMWDDAIQGGYYHRDSTL
jgi:hypothetical protein